MLLRHHGRTTVTHIIFCMNATKVYVKTNKYHRSGESSFFRAIHWRMKIIRRILIWNWIIISASHTMHRLHRVQQIRSNHREKDKMHEKNIAPLNATPVGGQWKKINLCDLVVFAATWLPPLPMEDSIMVIEVSAYPKLIKYNCLVGRTLVLVHYIMPNHNFFIYLVWYRYIPVVFCHFSSAAMNWRACALEDHACVVIWNLFKDNYVLVAYTHAYREYNYY